MATIDREGLIALLDRLSADDDATVVGAARAAHRMAVDAGLAWEDLIRSDLDSGETVDEAPAAGLDTTETARLIESLLRKDDLSDALREELVEMKRNIALGELDAMDVRYVRALARRLRA